MERLTKLYIGLLAGSILFALWGCTRWLRTREFEPEIAIATTSVAHFEKAQPKQLFGASRYAPLEKGELFFAALPTPAPIKVQTDKTVVVKMSRAEFVSKLVLYGVTKGAAADLDRAIVGLLGDSSKQTWLVSLGSVVAGETVIGITEQGIRVKNATGMGAVGLMPE